MNVLFWMSTSFKTTSRHLLISILKELCKAGHHVTVLKKRVDGELEELPSELAEMRINCISIPIKSSQKSNLAARFFKDIEYVLMCKKHLYFRYDAIFVQSTNVAGIVSYYLKKFQPDAITTLNVQDIFPYNAVYSGKITKRGLIFKVMAAQQRYAYKNADHVITISEDMKDLLMEDGISAEKIEVVYNWSYQDELYERDKLDFTPVAHMFSKNYFNVVYAGNIGVMQNVDILIEAAKLLKVDNTIWFHIIGNGVYKDKLQARAKKYGITNISFWPMQPSGLAPLIYCFADVNVIPLVKNIYRTALPSKTATCMACGSPIIYAIGKDSRFGQRVEKETGCPVVDSDNVNEMVKAIKKMKNKSIPVRTTDFFMRNMGITKNSAMYANIITSN